MKKSILLVAALFAAFTVSAGEVIIDLSQYAKAGDNANEVTPSLADGVLTVNYNMTGAEESYPSGGVSYALNQLNVTELAFDYKGDSTVATWVSFLVYLEDSEGGLWYSSAADLSISSWNQEWASKNYMPADVLWETTTKLEPVKPFVKLYFIANPPAAQKGSFAIRNVKLTIEDATAISNTAVETKSAKMIRNGQMVIMRDGKCFNALGAEMK